MKHNYLDNYELVNGYALIDTDFSIITANEKMYKFLGAVIIEKSVSISAYPLTNS